MTYRINLPRQLYRADDPRFYAQYGAFDVLARYAGLPEEPGCRRGLWLHGWKRPEENIHPEYIIGTTGRFVQDHGRGAQVWVWREDQAEYLKGMGLENVKALAAPFAYLPEIRTERLPESLLVMPPHSNIESRENLVSQEYIDFVAGLRSEFGLIAVCLAPACLNRGLWIEDYKRIGVNVIVGADINDRNSLYRMNLLFRLFEYVTMPTIGSQLVYSAYCGAKPSVCGPDLLRSRENLAECAFYKNYPEGIELSLKFTNRRSLEEAARWCLCRPRDAKQCEEWGRTQLGFASRMAPNLTITEMGWDIVRT